MKYYNTIIAIGLVISWAVLLFFLALIELSSSRMNVLAGFYNVFVLYGGLGVIFPFLTFPLLPKLTIWRKIRLLLLCMGIYFFAFFIFATDLDLDSNFFEPIAALGGAIGGMGVGFIYALFSIKKRMLLYVLSCTLVGWLSFWPVMLEKKDDFAFIIGIPLWVLSVGLITVWALTTNGQERSEK